MKKMKKGQVFLLMILIFTLSMTLLAQEVLREERSIQEGVSLYKAGRYEEAIEIFSEILKMSTVEQENIDAFIYTGLIYFSLQRQEEAKRSIEGAIQMKPDLDLKEENIITPEFITFFKECKNNLVGIGYIESIPSGALVYLDKKKMGQTPIKLELLSQKYYIQVFKPWYESIEQEIEIEKSIVKPIKLDLTKNRNWKTFLRSSAVMAVVFIVVGFL